MIECSAEEIIAVSIFDSTLHIPHERGFFEPATRRLDRVTLPLAAGPAPRFYGAAALAAFAAFACVCLGAMFLHGGDRGGGLLFGATFLVAALLPAAVALVALRDLRCPRPWLVIDAEGVLDRRLGLPAIAWAQIAAADLVTAPSGINGVRLTLREPGAPLYNPMRLGGWSADWRQRRRTRLIPLLALDSRPHALAHTMLELARRHGAEVDRHTAMGIARVF